MTIHDDARQDGSLGESVKKGITQIEDWEAWIEKHFSGLKAYFDKLRNLNSQLPEEFYEFDKSRIHYAVVAGRRHNYKPSTYRKRRTLLNEKNIRILHYDNPLDASLRTV